jgi:uncharacterized membrane protein YkvA (DUF1232 family)
LEGVKFCREFRGFFLLSVRIRKISGQELLMLERLKQRARTLKNEAFAVYLAARDPRTPWYAKALIFFVVAHTFSPIDLIPDFIPILGYLDDLIITPGGLWLAVRLIPPEVLEEARRNARQAQGQDRSVSLVGALIVFSVWIVILIGGVCLILSIAK